MGRNNVKFYAQDMNNRVLERLELEQQLRYALNRGELILYYQPQLELVGGLYRWSGSVAALATSSVWIDRSSEVYSYGGGKPG